MKSPIEKLLSLGLVAVEVSSPSVLARSRPVTYVVGVAKVGKSVDESATQE